MLLTRSRIFKREILADIWSRDASQYPAPGPVHGWIGFLLRVKCSICVLLGREGSGRHMSWDCVPVYVGPLHVTYYDGPSADWQEIGVDYGWRGWRFYRYRNGI